LKKAYSSTRIVGLTL